MRGFGAEVDRVICPSTVTGLSCGAGFIPVGAFHRRNSRRTWVSSSAFLMSVSAAKRCCLRSLNYGSHTTLEPNKSVRQNRAREVQTTFRKGTYAVHFAFAYHQRESFCACGSAGCACCLHRYS